MLDDILGVILLALLYEFSTGGGINPANAGMVIVITLTTLLPPLVMKWFYGYYVNDFRTASSQWDRR